MTDEVAELRNLPSGFMGQIGVARADITPPVGIFSRTWGAARHDTARSIHRPLTLNVLTLAADAATPPLVLIEADASWWQSLELWRRVQSRLLDSFSLEPARLIFAVSHSHAAPPLTLPEANTPGGALLADYLQQVEATAVSSVRTALDEACHSTLDWHGGRCQLAAVRDLPEPVSEGVSPRTVCGFNPRRQADDTLLVGRITGADGRLRATLSNYACHCTTLAWENEAISPDYVGAMRETVERETGAPALFLQGASGELAPRHQYVADLQVADRHGRQLGHATLATLYDMQPPGCQLTYQGVVESGAPLAIWRPARVPDSNQLAATVTEVALPLKDWPSGDELDRQWATCDDRAVKERLRRRRHVRRAVGDGPEFKLPIWTWRMGETVLVGSMLESYSMLQRELRQRFPQRPVVVGNLINGSLGYLPPADCYDQNIYQVWQTPFALGSLEIVLEAMTRSICQITGSSEHA